MSGEGGGVSAGAAAGAGANPAEELYAFAAGLRYEHLPPEVSERVKLSILDSLCTAVAGSGQGEGSEAVLRTAHATGGAGNVPAVGFGEGLSPLSAALVNGSTGHSLNFDMVGPFGAHLGVITFAAPMAAAEMRGGIGGREFVAAVAAGAEVMSRVAAGARAAVRDGQGVNARVLEGQLLGYIGAAVASAHVLGLDAAGVHDAVGLALMQAAGTMEVVHGGDVPAKAVYGGFANHGGLLAASLAASGLRANIDVLQGQAGLYSYHYGAALPDGDVLVEGLGRRYRLMESRFKLWPTSGLLHPFIEGVVRGCAEHRVNPADVERVVVSGPAWLRPWTTPEAARRRPANAAAASNSLQFALAKAITAGTVRLSDLTPAGLNDPAAGAMADRIEYVEVNAADAAESVVITLRDGSEVHLRPETPRGSPGEPLPTAEVDAKFLDCLANGARPVPEDAVRALLKTARALELLDDVRELWRPFRTDMA
jgi:2-methylcitrate dehydratase PrpD